MTNNAKKKESRTSIHVQLTDEEMKFFTSEMEKIGINSRSNMARICIRQALKIGAYAQSDESENAL